MANFSYKKDTKIAMKVKGIYDSKNMTVFVEDDESTKSLSTLLSDFDGLEVSINVSVSTSEELEEPENDDEDEENAFED